mmetsp:Transcript_15888/g.62082  ORF Transcript_15888/g.62082 Transcript_15888/m.62082 type:complete len:474 (-) Transcript_15888:31-1452(-)
MGPEEREDVRRREGVEVDTESPVEGPPGLGKRQTSVGELMSVTVAGILGNSGSLRTWQVRIFICIYVGYASCYAGKQSFNGLVQAVLADPTSGLDVAGVGMVGSATAMGYTAGKVVATLLLDSVRVRTLFPLVVLGIGLVNVAFACSNSLPAYILFWGGNGLLQGLSWQPCARLLTVWYPVKERARWWGVVSTCGTVSSGISQVAFPQLCAWLAGYDLGWRTAMALGSLFPILVSLVVGGWLRESPSVVGLDWEPRLLGGQKKPAGSEQLPMVQRLKIVWGSWEVQLLSFASLLIYIVRTAVNNWLAVFLMEAKGYSALAAGSALFWFEIGGAIGTTVAGWLTDRVFGGRRAPGMVCYSAAAVAVLAGLYWLSSPLPYSIAVFFFGFFVYGPQAFLGMMVAETADRRALASAVGYNGLMSGLGAMAAGYPISLAVVSLGWWAVFSLFGLCLGGTLLLLLPLWSRKHGRVPKRM